MFQKAIQRFDIYNMWANIEEESKLTEAVKVATLAKFINIICTYKFILPCSVKC